MGKMWPKITLHPLPLSKSKFQPPSPTDITKVNPPPLLPQLGPLILPKHVGKSSSHA